MGDKSSGVDSQHRLAVARTIDGQSKAWLKLKIFGAGVGEVLPYQPDLCPSLLPSLILKHLQR